jgi:hypothetical protein
MALLSDTTKPDVRLQPILTEIEKILVGLERIKGKTFTDTDVYLDGREFINCYFKNCKMFAKLGCFVITGDIHMDGCTFVFLPPAEAIKNTMNVLSQQPHRSKS